MSLTGISFGIHLPVRMLPGAGPNPPSAALLVDTVDAAKKSGFSSVWVTDHIVYMDPWLDCMMMLAAIVETKPTANVPMASPERIGKTGGKSMANPKNPPAIETVLITPAESVFQTMSFLRCERQWSSRSSLSMVKGGVAPFFSFCCAISVNSIS